MNPVRLLAAAMVAASIAVTTVILVDIDGDAIALGERLNDQDELVYAVGLWWVLAAPIVFVLAAVAVREEQWRWVVLSLAHLVVLVTEVRFLDDELSDGIWIAVGISIVLGVISCVAAVGARKDWRAHGRW